MVRTIVVRQVLKLFVGTILKIAVHAINIWQGVKVWNEFSWKQVSYELLFKIQRFKKREELFCTIVLNG